MKILRLETYNLASLEGKNVIDFESGILGESNIFCIVGPTGSGKSTILDAICLPLYGCAPRYPKKERGLKIRVFGLEDEDEKNRLSPSDPRNILTDGQKLGYSHLTFQANDGKVYRAEWSVQFKTKKYANAETRLFLLTNDDKGNYTEKEVDWNDLQQIIGLDFQQFQRTVLIAQGTFADFLNSKDEDRSALLEKLVGNQDIYEHITDGIKDKDKEAKTEYDTLRLENETYAKDLLKPEDYDAAKSRLKELDVKENERQKQLKVVESQLKWFADDREYQKTLQNRNAALQKAQLDKDGIKDEEKLLKLHDDTLDAVNIYNQLVLSKSKEVGLKKEIHVHADKETKLQTVITVKESEQKVLRENADKAATILNKEKPVIDKAKGIVVELRELQKVASDKNAFLKKAERELTKANLSVKTNEENIAKANNAVKTQEDKLSDLQKTITEKQNKLDAAVNASASAFNDEQKKIEGLDAEAIQNAKSDADNTVRTIEKNIEYLNTIVTLKDKIKESLSQRDAFVKRNEAIDKQLSALTITDLDKEVNTLTQSYTLMTSENWAEHRLHLHDGDPCPLCGSTTHPYHDKSKVDAVISEHKTLLDQKREELDKLRKLQTNLTAEKSGNDGKISQIERSLKEYHSDIDKSELALTIEMAEEVNSTLVSCKESLSKAKNEAAAAAVRLSDYNNLNKVIARLRSKMEKAEKDASLYKDTSAKLIESEKDNLTKLKESLTKLATQRDSLSEQLKKATIDKEESKTSSDAANENVKVKSEELCSLMQGKDPAVYEKQLTTEKDEAQRKVDGAQKDIETLRNRLSDFKGQSRQMAQQLDTLLKDIDTQHSRLTEEIARYNESSDETVTEDTVRSLATMTVNWTVMKSKHKSVNDALLKAKTQCETAESDIKKHAETKPLKDEEKLIVSQTELNAHSYADDIVNLKVLLRKHDDAKSKMGKQEELLKKASENYNDWHEIYDAIGGDGKTLRKVVQSYTLRFLVAHANAQIRRFNNRYELKQVKNSLALRVIDHDRGNDERDTTSLSGGETFIVSLGLALGLSSLSSRNISFGNLFIDEGFGTLDQDSLATVIDALSNLQTSQGKKVGVISHTDTMSERISTQIQVIKEGNSGKSHIEIR